MIGNWNRSRITELSNRSARRVKRSYIVESNKSWDVITYTDEGVAFPTPCFTFAEAKAIKDSWNRTHGLFDINGTFIPFLAQ